MPFGQDTHAFRVILYRAKLNPIKSVEELNEALNNEPERVLVISLGQSTWLNQTPIDFVRLLRNGGAFLGASDQRAIWAWQPPFQTAVDGRFVRIDPQSGKAYRGLPDCPLVDPSLRTECPVFLGLTRVATNRPSFLELPDRRPPIAWLPKGCERDGEKQEQPLPFATGGTFGNGRFLLLADHSVFINDMMLQDDNDNFDLARSAIDWLSDHGKRDRAFFMDDGQLVTDFNVPVKEVPPPPLPSEADLIKMFNKTVVGLEKEDFFHRQLFRFTRRDLLLRGLVIALTVLLGGFLLVRSVRARHHVDPQIPLPGPTLAAVAPAPGVMHQRQDAALAAGNFWEAAHDLARQFFESAPGASGTNEPRLDGADERVWRTKVRRLWQLAQAKRPWRVTARQFEQTVNQVDELKAALAQGTLHWTT